MDKEASKRSDSSICSTRDDVDQGWAWVIVFSGGIGFSVAAGIVRSFSVIFDFLLLRYKETALATAFVPGLHSVIKMCSSPLVSALCNRFGHRPVCISAGLVCFIGALISAWAPSLGYLYLGWSVLVAIGTNMMVTPSFAMIMQYFDKKRSRAMAVATSFNGLGGMALGPLLQFFFTEYGYTGTMMIVGALMLNFCITGALMRPISDVSSMDKEIELDKHDSLNQHGKSFSNKDTAKMKEKAEEHCIHDFISCPKIEAVESMEEAKITLKDSQLRANKDEEVNDSLTGHTTSSEPNSPRRRNYAKFIVDQFDLTLLKNAQFTSFSILLGGGFFCFNSTNTFLSGIAQEHGMSRNQVGLLLLTISAIDIPARLLSGTIFDLKVIKRWRFLLYSIICILMSVFCAIIPLVHSIVGMFISWSIFQFFKAVFHALHLTVMSDVVEKSRITSAIGLMRFFQGIGMLLGSSIGGFLKDYFGTYTWSFYSSAAVVLLVTILFMFQTVCKPVIKIT